MTAPATTNQYADDTTVAFATNAVLPADVAEAYMDYQARVRVQLAPAPTSTSASMHEASFSATVEEVAEAFSAGYEQAHRAIAKNCNPQSWNAIGTRSITGIRFPSKPMCVKAFQAGVQSRVHTDRRKVAWF